MTAEVLKASEKGWFSNKGGDKNKHLTSKTSTPVAAALIAVAPFSPAFEN